MGIERNIFLSYAPDETRRQAYKPIFFIYQRSGDQTAENQYRLLSRYLADERIRLELRSFMHPRMQEHLDKLLERKGVVFKGTDAFSVSMESSDVEPHASTTSQYEMDLRSTGGVDAELERVLLMAQARRSRAHRDKDALREDLLYLRPRDM